MKKLVSFFILLLGIWFEASADHITGGEMYYTFSGLSNGEYHYMVTLKMFMRCNSGRQFNNPAIVSVFDKASHNRVKDVNASLSRTETLSLTNPNKCITNPPTVCYEVGYYEFDLSVPASDNGYVIAAQVNYRIAGISNLTSGYSNIG